MGPAPDQHEHWARTFAARPDFLGRDPSGPGRTALAMFLAGGVHDVVELGPGQGRDTLLFAAEGLSVTALDYAETGLQQIAAKATAAGNASSITTVVADVREPLPFPTASFDACYAHMLLCMALATAEIERLVQEVRRVLRAGGLFFYTVRNTADSHFGAGIGHGEDQFETGGFIVHFFDRPLIDRLAAGFDLIDVAHYEEGKLPRRLSAVTMRKT